MEITSNTIKDMLVPEELKPKLRKIYGRLCTSAGEAARVLSSTPNKGKVITVGDVVSYNIISAGANPDIIVYDGMERREKAKSWMKNFLDAYMGEHKTVENPAGHIRGELWMAALQALRTKGKSKIFVKGEDDLAVLPFVILSSVGDCVLYGVPNKGIDLIVVNENIKNEFKRILKLLKENKEEEKTKAQRLREERIREMFRGKKR